MQKQHHFYGCYINDCILSSYAAAVGRKGKHGKTATKICRCFIRGDVVIMVVTTIDCWHHYTCIGESMRLVDRSFPIYPSISHCCG